ncbi:hypothetical protein E2C01_019413 [Portunus trituberculatus]|uniref:Uncharacterized protein n=1 Tax=Portunus trituberculatus TaxID=210409 RepID=A0A5B7DYY0_PORTR|nr:hypothetical protein [Portunus trituberculatus]
MTHLSPQPPHRALPSLYFMTLIPNDLLSTALHPRPPFALISPLHLFLSSFIICTCKVLVPGRSRVRESGRGVYLAGQAQLGAAIGPRRNEMEIEKLLRQFYSHYPLHVREVIGNCEEDQ